jgi:two-component system KDP operon response regulator KdpE
LSKNAGEAGADDFLSKPFNPIMLLARVKNILRRNGHINSQADKAHHNHGHLRFDVERRVVLIKGRRIKLSPVEFRLLVYLARNAGKVLTYDHILTNVWGNEHSRNIDHVQVYVSSLRRKIEENSKDPRYILTVPGVGYIFERDFLLADEEASL